MEGECFSSNEAHLWRYILTQSGVTCAGSDVFSIFRSKSLRFYLCQDIERDEYFKGLIKL